MARARYYTPPLDRDLVSSLYHAAKARRIPITQLASSLVREGLARLGESDSSESCVVREDRAAHLGQGPRPSRHHAALRTKHPEDCSLIHYVGPRSFVAELICLRAGWFGAGCRPGGKESAHCGFLFFRHQRSRHGHAPANVAGIRALVLAFIPEREPYPSIHVRPSALAHSSAARNIRSMHQILPGIF